ncbi:MAG: NADH-quinone oxidoreductase subunit NuoG [Candidatus Binataceae bacterium]
MPQIYIDGKAFDVKPDQNALEACLSLKMNLPYFCWHPAMGAIGACRQCAVKEFKDEKDTKGKIVVSCMTPVVEGLRISVEDPEARKFRAGIIEGMMENHPHDCPVCDEGGECHLQDMTVMTGHVYRSYRFNKRTFRNQNLGPFVNQEMNRCIQCYRCVRFYREYAGGDDFNAFRLRDVVFYGRKDDGVLENEFAGNLIEVCPTGVFTDKTFKQHYTRKWDLTMAPSVCIHCSLGCNTTAAERYGMLRRILTRYNGDVNGYFICDRGRFGYEFVNSERRIREPLLKRDGAIQPVTKAAALEHLGEIFAGNKKIVGIGSPRATLEANFALRTLVGAKQFYMGMADDESRLVLRMLEILREGPARTPTLHEVELSDAVFVLGEDVTNTAPIMALRLRQSARQQPFEIARKLKIPLWQDDAVREALHGRKGPFFIASVSATRLDDVATETYRAAPDDLSRLGFAIAHELDASAPEVPNLATGVQSLAARIAHELKYAKQPLVVSGAGCQSNAVVQAAANIARALCKSGNRATLSFAMPECNTVGLGMIGGETLSAAFGARGNGAVDAVIILENDLYRRAPADAVDAFLKSAGHVIVLDHLATRTTAMAELVLPAATFAESDGTLVNNEGRAQRSFQAFVPNGDVAASWQWLRDAIAASGRAQVAPWQDLDEIIAAISEELPPIAAIRQAAPPSTFRLSGAKVPREPQRYSGRASMRANIDVSEPKPPVDPNSPLSFTMEGTLMMEGTPDQPPAAIIPFFWTPGWNSIQATNKFQSEIAGSLEGGNPGVRMIEQKDAGAAYFADIPLAFESRVGEWLLVPFYHIFGSEELSHSAPAIAGLARGPYLALRQNDADSLNLKMGQEVDVNLKGRNLRLAVKIDSSLASGTAGIPTGLPELEAIRFPAWCRISRPT